MEFVECRIPEDAGYLITIGDIHLGDKSFSREGESKLKGYISWVLERPNARIFLNGDLVNCASRTSKSSPHQQNMPLSDQKKAIVELFFPVRKQIIGAISGNHEQRAEDIFGDDPTIDICDKLNVPYCKYSAVVKFLVGIKDKGEGRREDPAQTYIGFFHHSTGGGTSSGGKLNRIEALKDLFSGADFYCGSHNHMLGVAVTEIPSFDTRNNRIKILRQYIVSCGGFLSWDGSYAEQKQLPPMRIGSPRIRFDGSRENKDLHISI